MPPARTSGRQAGLCNWQIIYNLPQSPELSRHVWCTAKTESRRQTIHPICCAAYNLWHWFVATRQTIHTKAPGETLNRLFSERGTCDDILIVKHGLLTDTSIANIALFDGTHWYTPRQPLLKGTKRAFLLDEGILMEKELRCEDLPAFSTIRLFNAMIEWGEMELPVQNIIA